MTKDKFKILQWASEAVYLTAPYPDNWEEMSEEDQHEYINDHIVDFYQGAYEPWVIDHIQDLADETERFMENNQAERIRELESALQHFVTRCEEGSIRSKRIMPERFQYMMMDRARSDLVAYINTMTGYCGNRKEDSLVFGGDVIKHVAECMRHYRNLPETPKWLTQRKLHRIASKAIKLKMNADLPLET